MYKNKFFKKGFTLIELLVVIAVIGILTSIVIGSTSISQIRARDYTRTNDLHLIQLTLGVYFDVNKSYPGNLSSLTSGGFINSLPIDPSTKVVYQYAYTLGGKYCLGTFLEQTTVIPNDNAGCVLNTCKNPTTGATNVACNYTVQR